MADEALAACRATADMTTTWQFRLTDIIKIYLATNLESGAIRSMHVVSVQSMTSCYPCIEGPEEIKYAYSGASPKRR